MKKSIIFLAFMLLGVLTSSCSGDDEVTSTLTTEDLIINVNEEVAEGIIVGKIKASSTTGSVNFNLISQTPNEALELEDDGGLEVNRGQAFDYEQNKKVTAKVEVSDVNDKKIVNVIINIIDIDESTLPKAPK